MKIRPLGNRVLVRVAARQTKTPGGILIPDGAQEKPRHGEVLSLGKGKLTEKGSYIEIGVRKGEVVLFGQWAGNEVPGDETLLILAGDDIIGVME